MAKVIGSIGRIGTALNTYTAIQKSAWQKVGKKLTKSQRGKRLAWYRYGIGIHHWSTCMHHWGTNRKEPVEHGTKIPLQQPPIAAFAYAYYSNSPAYSNSLPLQQPPIAAFAYTSHCSSLPLQQPPTTASRLPLQHSPIPTASHRSIRLYLPLQQPPIATAAYYSKSPIPASRLLLQQSQERRIHK